MSIKRDHPRGGRWVGQGEDFINSRLDKRREKTAAPNPSFDWSSPVGAIRLCAQITAYWRDLGSTSVLCHIVPKSTRGRPPSQDITTITSIRSNLIGGLPPKE